MPCRTDDWYDEPKSSNTVSKQKYDELKKEADNVTRLLCSVITVLTRSNTEPSYMYDSVDGLKKWWEHHQEIDRKRIEKEVEKAMKSIGELRLSDEAKELVIKHLKK